MKKFPIALCSLAGVTLAAHAQLSLLFADRDANKLWRVTDVNNDGIFQVPDELFVWFDETNAAGTQAIDNINTLAIRQTDGLVVGADQVLQRVFLFQDLNGDGDALDPGESRVAESAPNASSINIAFGTGAAFNSAGELLVVNAGNGFGADAIYRLIDSDSDGLFQSANEILPYVTTGAFGTTPNGPYSPQEIFLTPPVSGLQTGFLRNSSANLHGIYKFIDSNDNKRADDSGEFTPYWTLAASGVTPSAGFPLEPDYAHPGSFYTHQIATGGIDQIVRVTDRNGNGNANDPGEAVLAYVNSDSGFTAVDLVCLPNGDLLISDNSGNRIFRLHDANNDGTFSAAEASVIFTGGTTVTQVRQMIAIPSPAAPCPADFNHDGGVDGADVEAFYLAWEAGSADGDVNRDGGVDGADVETFFAAWEAGGCN